MRSHRRRAPLDHVLVAGDLTELDSIRALLSLMPETAYGQVYVECSGSDELPAITSPARVTVNRVCRTELHSPGEPLSAAVAGWVGEWMPEDPAPDRVIAIWAGASVTGGVPTVGTRLERL